jgi:hypothetical protein
MTIFLFFFLPPTIVWLDFLAHHVSFFFSVVHYFYFLSVHDISLIFLSSSRIVSLDFHACQVSYFSFFFVHSFYFVSVHGISLIFISSSWYSFIPFPCVSCLLFFSLNCPFLLFHFCAWYFPYSSLRLRIVSRDFHAWHVSYFALLIAHSFYFISVHDIFPILLFILESFHLTSMHGMSLMLLS